MPNEGRRSGRHAIPADHLPLTEVERRCMIDWIASPRERRATQQRRLATSFRCSILNCCSTLSDDSSETKHRGSTGSRWTITKRICKATCKISKIESIAVAIVLSRVYAETFPKETVKRDLWESLAWKIRSSSGRSSWSWNASTRWIFMIPRTVTVPSEAATKHWPIWARPSHVGE
ncbi:hypothetical protein Rcae01_06726 [Novipirellula caenicola]|uniref:Transposase IS30-like HTH domain-containing protein n=1 Tax=Novipirellula caenicola TaxID=1536901 RepID=A0ABP9W320_9BACT